MNKEESEKWKQEYIQKLSTREGTIQFMKEGVEEPIQMYKDLNNEKLAEKTRKTYAYLWRLK